jgi:tetratricopeptide (TPR) repeat protein
VAANDARSYNIRGLVRLQQGQLKGALDDFDLSITMNPAAGYAYENRALAHKSMGNRDLALADLSRALSVNSRSARALTFRAQIYIADGDLDRAIAEFKQALAIDPNFKPAQMGLQSALVSKSMSQIDKVRVNG